MITSPHVKFGSIVISSSVNNYKGNKFANVFKVGSLSNCEANLSFNLVTLVKAFLITYSAL